MDPVQAGMSVAVTREALDFQASMSAAVINGSINKSQEMQQVMTRSAGLAAEGVGAKLNITV